MFIEHFYDNSLRVCVHSTVYIVCIVGLDDSTIVSQCDNVTVVDLIFKLHRVQGTKASPLLKVYILPLPSKLTPSTLA